MVKHLVMWKMKPTADSRSGLENAKILVQRLNDLKIEDKLIALLNEGAKCVIVDFRVAA
jgi:hypothetical protein